MFCPRDVFSFLAGGVARSASVYSNKECTLSRTIIVGARFVRRLACRFIRRVFYCIAWLGALELFGRIERECQDTNGTKIAYKVHFFGDAEHSKQELYVIASKDVKHSGTDGFESRVSALSQAEGTEPQSPLQGLM